MITVIYSTDCVKNPYDMPLHRFIDMVYNLIMTKNI